MTKLKDPFKSASRFALIEDAKYSRLKVTEYENDRIVVATNGHLLVGLFCSTRLLGIFDINGKRKDDHFPNWEQIMFPKKGCVYINKKKTVTACDRAIEQDKEAYDLDLTIWKTIGAKIKGEAEKRRHQSNKPFKRPKLIVHGGVTPLGSILWGDGDLGNIGTERILDPKYLKKLVKLLGDPATITAKKDSLTAVRLDSDRGFAVLMPMRI